MLRTGVRFPAPPPLITGEFPSRPQDAHTSTLVLGVVVLCAPTKRSEGGPTLGHPPLRTTSRPYFPESGSSLFVPFEAALSAPFFFLGVSLFLRLDRRLRDFSNELIAAIADSGSTCT